MLFRGFKRGFDFISALLLFVVISPLFLILMVLVRIKLGSPVFFTQARSGKNQKRFYIKKFRTMTNETDSKGELLPDEKRQTKWGGVLRSTSLDELPQLLNIIAGDMSVIGPRPLPPMYDEYYSEYESNRFRVRGGLIQPEVLHDTILPTWDEQLKWEADYARNLSLKTDIEIFVAVFKTLVQRNNSDYGEIVRDSLINERKEKEYMK
ncbi:MAG: sugar transferase [Lachnospiraceae bacterium]|nr:sugar transferase [Lachnospiraceae bacterium]